MEKKRYITPCVCETELCEQSMLCLSGDSADINHKYDDAIQLSNKDVWDDIW